MRYSVSDTAEHGDYTGGPKIVTDDTRKAMKKMLEDIQSGEYARGWIAENAAGRPWFNKVREAEQNQLHRAGGRAAARPDAIPEAGDRQAGHRQEGSRPRSKSLELGSWVIG